MSEAGGLRRETLRLGASQTLAWASSYYLPATLAEPMARSLGMGVPTVFAAFSGALLVAALIGPVAGRAIDRRGGRSVLMWSNGVFALGLSSLAAAQGAIGLFLAWALIGVAMGMGLYEAAFASLVRARGAQARSAITQVTLIAGFASTVGWPLTTWLASQWDWRTAVLAWAALHLLLGLPLNAGLRRHSVAPERSVTGAVHTTIAPSHGSQVPIRLALAVAMGFAISAFIGTAMAAHLPSMLKTAGASAALAVTAAALLGPAQVAARLMESLLQRHGSVLVVACVAAALHPLAALALMVLGPMAAIPFAILHGAGNGLMTIVTGALPLAVFGSRGYGERQGWLMAPARMAQALAPWAFAGLLAPLGVHALVVTAVGGLLTFALFSSIAVGRSRESRLVAQTQQNT